MLKIHFSVINRITFTKNDQIKIFQSNLGGLGFYSLFDKHLLNVTRSNKKSNYNEVKFDKKYPITLTPQTFLVFCLWVFRFFCCECEVEVYAFWLFRYANKMAPGGASCVVHKYSSKYGI